MEDSGTSTALIPLLERISLDADDATSRVVDLPGGSRVWLVGDYDDARTVLTDPRFSADDQIPGYPCLLPAPPRPGALSFLRMDAPQHGRVRRVLTPSFTMRRIEKMRPGIQDATRRLIEDMREEGPPVDLVDRFALPLPSLVICQLLGVPYEDHGARSRSTAAPSSAPTAPPRRPPRRSPRSVTTSARWPSGGAPSPRTTCSVRPSSSRRRPG